MHIQPMGNLLKDPSWQMENMITIGRYTAKIATFVYQISVL